MDGTNKENEVETLKNQLQIARSEINNLRYIFTSIQTFVSQKSLIIF